MENLALSVTGDRLDIRALNRALLERQLLMRRSSLDAAATVEHLVGMQAQAPLAPYVGLWTRLGDFAAEELAELMRGRQMVRTHVMRSTIHLVTARDCLALRPLMQQVISRTYAGSAYARDLAGADVDALVAAGRELLAERPLSRPELGRILAERWPGHDPGSMSAAVCFLVPVVQVTPRGVWGATGRAEWATIESWLGRSLPGEAPAPDEVVLRYLAAYGPAAAADVRTWSGLTGLGEVLERLRPRLRAFRDEHGRELLDLPNAPRPDPETPAPPRFLPEYDNALLSHADRSRINDRGHRVPLPSARGATSGTLLVDGFYRGNWRIVRDGDRATLEIEPLERTSKDEADAVTAEGMQLLAFAAADAGTRDARFSS